MPDPIIAEKLRRGGVIPAHPLALTESKKLDERRQRALSRYYLSAGAAGLAVGVHTTQFAIHESQVGLYRPVLESAVETAIEYTADGVCTRPIMIAGIVGKTDQAVTEARLATELGYDLGLLSLTALRGRSVDELIEHARCVGEVIGLMGFYLQPAISGMRLPLEFWRRFVEIPAVHAVKIAPFDRYCTLDVLEAVAHSNRAGAIALYTGNDDHILLDLLSPREFQVGAERVTLRIVGGLLGQWACWTRTAVEHLEHVRTIRDGREPVSPQMLSLAGQLTLANRAIFDADHNFAGCIGGVSYVLQRQGLLANTVTLDDRDHLSPGQSEQIDRIIRDYPHLTDDGFVRANIETWLAP